MIVTPRHRNTTYAIAAILVLFAGLFSPSDAADISIDIGSLSVVSVSPDGNAIAAAIEGYEGIPDDSNDPMVVRWWNWNGADGRWIVPAYRVRALAWAADGSSLLVGGWTEDRFPVVPWWRLGAGGEIRAACKGLPIGSERRFGPMERGVASIAELTDGKVVTGGYDGTLAVWEGCSPNWLTSKKTCCFEPQTITVTPRGTGFDATGEGIWQGLKRGYKNLPPRHWSPSPWKAAPIKIRADLAGKTDPKTRQANGDDCTATIDSSGRITVAGAHPWTASIGADDWISLAANRNCQTVAAATSGRIVKVTPP